MPPKVAPNPTPFNLTPREIEIALLAWKALEGDSKINNAMLAAMANIGKPESAGRMWRGIKAKIEAATAGPAGSSSAQPAASTETTPMKKAPAKGGKKRTKKEADADGHGGDSGAESDGSAINGGGRPKKKVVKRTKVVKKEAPPESEGMDDDGCVEGEV